ncbi:PaaI family thioesterase [Alkalihalobacillus sp. BA299]|uniref:PaaI family thioesterase n=1 Tax=Alkalihalobacillus sp. BA299 TaxID=2815938 RepID=UPI001ADB3F46|nr:PaaI family thioesterase [Alkalihalobacillus sp. BA299]
MEQNELIAEINSIYQNGSEEDKQALASLINGMKKKQSGECVTYLSGITNMRSQFLDNGCFEVVMPIQPLIENPLKMTHGGITATLLDTAMGSILNLKIPEDKACVTAELKVNYIQPGRGKYLRCVATILHLGKQLCFSEGKVYNEENKLIASGSGTFFVIPRN